MNCIWKYLLRRTHRFLSFLKKLARDDQYIVSFRIANKYISKTGEVFFKIHGLGGAFDIKLKAASIAKNSNLLERFSFDDRCLIIIESNLCLYKIISINCQNSINAIADIKAEFNGQIYIKKYFIHEIACNKPLLHKLSKNDQQMISHLFNSDNVVRIDFTTRKAIKTASS